MKLRFAVEADPIEDGQDALDTYYHAWGYRQVLSELLSEMRQEIKHNDPETHRTTSEWRDWIVELIRGAEVPEP